MNSTRPSRNGRPFCLRAAFTVLGTAPCTNSLHPCPKCPAPIRLAGGRRHSLAHADGEARAGRSTDGNPPRATASASVLVLCGPGNNGGDGFVVARQLRDAAGPSVSASSAIAPALKGDAAVERRRAGAATSRHDLDDADLVVDALLGAGLDRDVTGELAEIDRGRQRQRRAGRRYRRPTGIDGATGAIRGSPFAPI